MRLYMAVTRDEYELPYAVEESPVDLARRLGTRADLISSRLAKGGLGIVAVDVEVEAGEVIERRRCIRCGDPLPEGAGPSRKYCDQCGEIQRYRKAWAAMERWEERQNGRDKH